MDDQDGQHEQDGSVGAGIDRRSALTKIGVGAAAAWTAPVILSRAAAGAATVPDCAVCDQGNQVVNGNAESGVLTPWTNTVGAWVVDTWTAITLAGIIPTETVGTNAFTRSTGSSSLTVTTMTQRVTIGPGCDGASVLLGAVIGAVCPSLGQATVAMTIDFRNAADVSVGAGGVAQINYVAGLQSVPSITSSNQAPGIVPAGAESAVITVTCSLRSTDETPSVAAVDNVSLTFDCLV